MFHQFLKSHHLVNKLPLENVSTSVLDCDRGSLNECPLDGMEYQLHSDTNIMRLVRYPKH